MAVKKEKEVEVPEVEEEAYVYPIWATAILWIARISAIMWILREAYTIRLYAINNYGRVIHEFDPWFNFRATQYLADNGMDFLSTGLTTCRGILWGARCTMGTTI